METGYSIKVGEANPPEVQMGGWDNKTQQPKGEQMRRFIAVGTHLLMAQCTLWAVRVSEDGKRPKVPYEITDREYKGKLEFLEWGDPDGQAIVCRYLTRSNSLDLMYQENVQKIKIDPEKEDIFIHLTAGINQFEYKTKALLILFLKAHAQNRDSVSKNPDPSIKGHQFYEITDKQSNPDAIARRELGIEVGMMIKEMSSRPAQLKNLITICGPRPEFDGVSRLSPDRFIYLALLGYADSNPNDLLAYINGYKEQVGQDFEKAKSYKALDLTKNGFIGFINAGKNQHVFEKLEGKGEEMIEYVLDNFLEDDIFKACQIFKNLVSKLK